MALSRGLSAHREAQAQSKGKFGLRLKEDQRVFIRPLAELDQDAKNFKDEDHLVLITKEWHNPEDFTKQIVDTMVTEGACVGQELLRKFGWDGDKNGGRGEVRNNFRPDAWRPKEFMYLPVAVKDTEDGDIYVEHVKFNMAPKAIQANILIDQHENKGTITDRWFAYSRTGKGQTDTNYKLTALDPDSKDKFDVMAYELPDLDAAAPNVPYASQRQALGVDVPAVSDENASRPTVSASAIDEQW